MTATRTNVFLDGCKVPAIIVDGLNGCFLRFTPCYHLVGNNTTYVTEFADGDFNHREELNIDFDNLTIREALRIAPRLSAYL